MDLISGSPPWLLAVLVLLLGAAATEDIVRRRISNWTVLGVIATAVIAMVAVGPSLSAWQNLLVFSSILVVGTFLFSAGLMGGGDVKLFASVGLWANLANAPLYVAAVLIAGGLLAAFFLLVARFRRRGGAGGGMQSAKGMPYGVAIAAGGLFLIGVQQLRGAATFPSSSVLSASEAARRVELRTQLSRPGKADGASS